MKNIYYLLVIICLLVSCSSKNCDKNKSEYEEGFYGGQTCRTVGASGTCSQYLSKMQEGGQYGCYLSCSECKDCYCEGWNDGYSGNNNKYPDEDSK